jgi:protein-tyrosine-phosphatase
MAEYLLKSALLEAKISDNFSVISAGTATDGCSPASTLAVQVMRDFDSNIAKHRSQKVTQKLLDGANVIFCLTENHRKFLLANFRGIEKKCFLVKEFLNHKNKDIADPFLGTIKDYEHVRDDIRVAMDSIVKFLVNDCKA